MGRNTIFFFQELWKNLTRNPLMTAAAASTTMVSLLTFGLSLAIITNINNIFVEITSQVEIRAFLKEKTDNYRIKQLQDEIMKLSHVRRVEYVSPSRALDKLQEDLNLSLDMPPEESAGYREAADEAGLKIVSLVAPTTSAHRIKTLADAASSFIYYVCREGVTGERADFASGVSEKVAEIKRLTKLPVAVGFGISTPEHVRAAASAGADGVIVGSAIVRKVEAFSQGRCSIDDIKTFVKSLADALKS